MEKHNKKSTIDELFSIITENTKMVINELTETQPNDFSIMLKKLYKMVKEEGFADAISAIAEDIYSFSDGDGTFAYDERMMCELLRDLFNYDLICFNDTEDDISIDYSNNEDIAELIKPYVNPKMCHIIAQSF